MARTYVFLVHGVGKHAADTWSDPWQRVLIDKLRTFAPYSRRSPEELERESIRFVPIGYDAVFEGFRQRWQNLAGALASSDFAAGTAAHGALAWVADQSDDALKNVFWEKVLDALLWATNPHARAAVIARVSKQLVDGLVAMNEENQGENTAHIVAHSLGTSVTHDALIALRAAAGVHGGTLEPARFQWRSVTMLANTSRLLEPRFDVSDELDPADFKVYGSAMKPGARSSLVKSYTSVRQRVDPITWPRRFQPMDWPNSAYADIETVHFDQLAGVHDFETYVANPFVHLPLFQTLMGDSRLGKPEEVERALKDLDRDFPRVADVEFPQLRALIDLDPNRPISLRQLVEFLVKAFRELH
jgi:hypothetical protein